MSLDKLKNALTNYIALSGDIYAEERYREEIVREVRREIEKTALYIKENKFNSEEILALSENIREITELSGSPLLVEALSSWGSNNKEGKITEEIMRFVEEGKNIISLYDLK